MHARTTDPTGTPWQNRQGWSRWHITWSVAIIAALGLALGSPSSVQAETFHCSASDVQCLIAAINKANASAKTNTVRLEAGTYTLVDVDNTTDGPNGLPSITGALTIQGEGTDLTIIERAASAPEFRLVHVAGAGALTLEEVTIRGGNSQGSFRGGMLNRGTLTLTNSPIADNSAGGGLANLSSGQPVSTMVITDSTIVGNSATGTGGGGLSLFEAGLCTIINSTVADNTGSGLFLSIRSSVTVINSTIAGNQGGGLNSHSIIRVELQNTLVAFNTSLDAGPDCSGSVTSLGNNLIGTTSGCTITLQLSDLTGDPGLDTFTDDGTPGDGHLAVGQFEMSVL